MPAIGPLEIRVDLLPPASDSGRSPPPPAPDSNRSLQLPHHITTDSEVTVDQDRAVDLESGVSGPQSSDELPQSAHCKSSTEPPELLPVAPRSLLSTKHYDSHSSKLLGAEAEMRVGAEAYFRAAAMM